MAFNTTPTGHSAAAKWTRDRIAALDATALRSIVRSTKPDGLFSEQVRWAREELSARKA